MHITIHLTTEEIDKAISEYVKKRLDAKTVGHIEYSESMQPSSVTKVQCILNTPPMDAPPEAPENQ